MLSDSSSEACSQVDAPGCQTNNVLIIRVGVRSGMRKEIWCQKLNTNIIGVRSGI